MSGKQRQRVISLDVFLEGGIPKSTGENDLPVIVVDKNKRRNFLRRRMSDTTRSYSTTNSSFCSSVTSCSIGSSSQGAAAAAASAQLCSPGASRWESIPCSRKGQRKQDALRIPRRDTLKLPSRTRTNDLKKSVSPATSKKCQKQVMMSPRIALRCDSFGSRRDLSQTKLASSFCQKRSRESS